MSIIQITVQFREEDKHTSQTLTLDGVRFRLDTYTNKVDDAWYLDLFDFLPLARDTHLWGSEPAHQW